MFNYIEILDSTLRDGEQTNGVSFLPHEKLSIARLLLKDVKVDRLEVASARVSEGEKEAVTMICRYAQQLSAAPVEDGGRPDALDSIEVLGFVDNGKSIQWITDCGGKVINMLTKGSRNHCVHQLSKTPDEHIADIKANVAMAHEAGLSVNVYLEDWSNGMRDSADYVYHMIESLSNIGIKRFMLPDTLGVLTPTETGEFFKDITTRFPDQHFDFHSHNDYDLAVGNTLAAVRNGAKGVHVTVNGLGERCGNAPLASVQASLHDQLGITTSIQEDMLNEVSRVVEGYSGVTIAPNQPIVGDNVFTQVAGVHADGDNKHNLYCNALVPERFGRKREYALGKNSGKANIEKNLQELGLVLTPEQTKKVTQRITELGDRKALVTQDDLPFIVADVLKHSAPEDKVKLKGYMVSLSYGLKPHACVKISINGKRYEADSSGDGQYDAFVKALRYIYKETLGRTFPMLENYSVTIPPGGRTDALVQTQISWRMKDGRVLRTRALDADQTEAAIKATIKMLNQIEPEFPKN